MITIKTNINQVVTVTLERLNELGDTDKLLRSCATSVLSLMKVRIHEQGLAADGQQIGTYSKGYMVVRTGSFGNAGRVSRGPNSGRLKDAGVFTKSRTGARPKYNRTSDTRVVLSLTRQMENDMKVIATNAGYGIGYTNTLNYQKSQWNEARYKKPIFSLSAGEEKAVADIVTKHVEDAFSG